MKKKKTAKPIKRASGEETKRISFYPFRRDRQRIEAFANVYAAKEGLRVHPGLREVFNFVLDLAQEALDAQQAQEAAEQAQEAGEQRPTA